MRQPGPVPPINPMHLVALGCLEGVVAIAVVLRNIVVPGSVHLERTSHLAWFVGALLLGSFGITHFVLRSAPLGRRAAAGEDVSDARKQVFVISIAIIVGALLVALVGPDLFQRALGDGPRVG